MRRIKHFIKYIGYYLIIYIPLAIVTNWLADMFISDPRWMIITIIGLDISYAVYAAEYTIHKLEMK